MEMETSCHWQTNLASQIWWDSEKMLILTQKLHNIHPGEILSVQIQKPSWMQHKQLIEITDVLLEIISN